MENLKKRIIEIVIGVLVAILSAVIIPHLGIDQTSDQNPVPPDKTVEQNIEPASDPESTKESANHLSDDVLSTTTPPSDSGNDSTSEQYPSTTQPKPQPTPPVEEKSYLQITVNGEKRTYYADSFEFNDVGFSSWFTFLKANKYDDNDSFYISLPPEISTGDTLLIKAKDINYDGSWKDMGNIYEMLSPQYSIQYKDRSGNSYIIGTSPNGEFLITIDEWQGRGGYAIGKLEGEIWPTSVDCIKFTDGTFKIKIANKIF